MEYPALRMTAGNFTGIGICEDCEEAVDFLPPNASMAEIFETLFDPGLSYSVEKVLVYRCPRFIAPLLEGHCVVEVPGLSPLERVLSPEEVIEALPAMTDDLLLGIMHADECVAACGAVLHNGYYDISVCVHPAHRGKGLAPALLARILSKTGAIPAIYRTREDNLPSKKLAKRHGFEKIAEYEGLHIHFPED